MKVVGAGLGAKSRRRKRLREVSAPEETGRKDREPGAWKVGLGGPCASHGVRPGGLGTTPLRLGGRGLMGSKPTTKAGGAGEKRSDQSRKVGCVEVCKCRFTKLVPVAWGLTLTHPGEATGRQEPPDGI